VEGRNRPEVGRPSFMDQARQKLTGMFAVQEMDDVNVSRETTRVRFGFGAEVAELIPGHSAPTDPGSKPLLERRQPRCEIRIAIRGGVQNRMVALRIEMANELRVARLRTPVREARAFEPDANWHFSVSPRRAAPTRNRRRLAKSIWR